MSYEETIIHLFAVSTDYSEKKSIKTAISYPYVKK
jgi:hypothetical protein